MRINFWDNSTEKKNFALVPAVFNYLTFKFCSNVWLLGNTGYIIRITNKPMPRTVAIVNLSTVDKRSAEVCVCVLGCVARRVCRLVCTWLRSHWAWSDQLDRVSRNIWFNFVWGRDETVLFELNLTITLSQPCELRFFKFHFIIFQGKYLHCTEKRTWSAAELEMETPMF